MLDEYLRLAEEASNKSEIIFTFGPDDLEIKQQLKSKLNDLSFNILIRDDFKSLWDFALFIGTAKLFVSTSTGPMHLAGLTNTNTISFFGNNLFASSKRWATISDKSCQNNFEIPSNYGDEFLETVKERMMEIL